VLSSQPGLRLALLSGRLRWLRPAWVDRAAHTTTEPIREDRRICPLHANRVCMCTSVMPWWIEEKQTAHADVRQRSFNARPTYQMALVQCLGKVHGCKLAQGCNLFVRSNAAKMRHADSANGNLVSEPKSVSACVTSRCHKTCEHGVHTGTGSGGDISQCTGVEA